MTQGDCAGPARGVSELNPLPYPDGEAPVGQTAVSAWDALP